MSDQDRKAEQLRITFPNLPEGGSAGMVKGPSVDEFERLTIFMRDLNSAKIFVKHALAAKEAVISEALQIAGLIKFLRCFENTGGLRQKPLRPTKIFDPVDRERLKSLIFARNKFVVHDEQTHPMQSSVLLLDRHDRAIDIMVASAPLPFQAFAISRELPRLIEMAFDFVKAAHFATAEDIKQNWNAQPDLLRQAIAAGGGREIVIDVVSDGDEPPEAPRVFDQDIAYLIPDEMLPI